MRWEGKPSDEEVEGYFDALREVVARLGTHALVYDARNAGMPTARQRRVIAELTRARSGELRPHCVGIAFVIDAVMLRGALSAILWLQPMLVRHVVLDSVDDAERWARARLDDSIRGVAC